MPVTPGQALDAELGGKGGAPMGVDGGANGAGTVARVSRSACPSSTAPFYTRNLQRRAGSLRARGGKMAEADTSANYASRLRAAMRSLAPTPAHASAITRRAHQLSIARSAISGDAAGI